MTRAFPVAVAVLSWLGSPSLAAFREPPCARAKAALAVREEKAGGAAALAARLLETSSDTDVQHYRLSLEIDPTTRYLTGSDIMTVRSQVAGLERFRFRLWVLLTIDAVLVDGRAATWQRLDDATVEVSLGRSYGVGEEFQLQVDYSGYAGGGILLDTHANTAVLSSLSEPWNAFTWWPAKDDNTDKATADLFLTAPAGMSAVSNGVLVGSEPVSGGRTRFHWHTDYLTAVYLISMSITNYQTATAFFTFGDLSMPVTLYLYPESNTPENRTAWFRAVDMLGTFSHLFGPYPFAAEKYGICEFPFSGGMEHQTITGQGGGSRFSEFLTAHELAHQWWGDLVTCATWHDIWLNEGFATYSEALWEEFKPGSPGLPALLSVMASLRPGNVNGTVYVSDDSDVRRIFSSTFSYQKGGWVLHMLRHVVGDEEFFATLATWRQAYGGGAATTEQFRAVAEQVHKADLSWFFNEWVYRPGAPQYAWGWRERQGADQRYAEVYLEQRQSASYPTFAMPLDVRVRTTAGDETRVGWSDARAEHLLVPVKAPVVGVDLDPDGWVLTEGVTTTGFVEGPPKIVTTWPPPGAAVIPEGVAVLRVGFQVDVQATGPDFTLTGPTGATVPLAFEYDAGSYTAVLRPAQLLGAGAYTLIVSDSITSRASGLRLDGELPAGALPSGDGLPGGATELHFFVVPAHHPRLRLVRAHDTPPT